jgi:hypothetical protein
MKEQFIYRKPILILSLLCFLSGSDKVYGQSIPYREELTVKAATALLTSHEMFRAPWVTQLHTGEIHAKRSDVEHYRPQYTVFKSLGLIELSDIKKESQDPQTSGFTERTLVSLTEKGKSESKNWKQNRENEWQVPVAARELVEIIKIHYDKDVPVGIEFFWTYVPNKMGEALQLKYPVEKAYAKLQFLEDGWKIIKIRALSS